MPKTRTSARLSKKSSHPSAADDDALNPAAATGTAATSAAATVAAAGASPAGRAAVAGASGRKGKAKGKAVVSTPDLLPAAAAADPTTIKRDPSLPIPSTGTATLTAASLPVASTSTATGTGTAGGGEGGFYADSEISDLSSSYSLSAAATPGPPTETPSLHDSSTSDHPSSLHAPPPPPPKPAPPLPLDRLTPLSSELLALILSFLVFPALPAPSSPVHSSSPPSPFPTADRLSLAALCLTCKSLLPHARAAMYRDLRVETRVQAHAVHRTLHGSETNRSVRNVEANVEMMAKTSSQWLGWFLFHSMHSLCGIIGSCRSLLSLTLYLPADSSAWTQSLCQSFVDLKSLHTLTKDLEPSLPSSFSPPIPYYLPQSSSSASATREKWSDHRGGGAGKQEGMDVGWRPRKSVSMWAVSQFIKPLSTLRSLTTLRLCGISSDSSTLPTPPGHALRLVEVVLIEVNITNTDLLQLLGTAQSLQRFTLWRSSLLSKRGLTHVLKKCPKLVELRVGGSWFGAKEEDEFNYPLDDALPYLPSLRLLHVSGSLISPTALQLPSLNLAHLFVTNSPSWTPKEVHSSLVKMPMVGGLGLGGLGGGAGGGVGVKRLTLPEMRDPSSSSSSSGNSNNSSSSHHRRGSASTSTTSNNNNGSNVLPGSGDQWNEPWRFTVKKTGEAKGVVVDSKWRPGRDEADALWALGEAAKERAREGRGGAGAGAGGGSGGGGGGEGEESD